jgi:hypothetical protein
MKEWKLQVGKNVLGVRVYKDVVTVYRTGARPTEVSCTLQQFLDGKLNTLVIATLGAETTLKIQRHIALELMK